LKAYVVFALTGLALFFGVKAMVLLNWMEHIPTYTLEIVLFLFFITGLIYRYLSQFASKGREIVSQFYLLSIAIKLLGGCSFIVAVFLLDKPNVVGNVILFLIGYIVFTGVEIGFLLQLKDAKKMPN
jgi:hypothetical protein